jgi:hypothetical protein
MRSYRAAPVLLAGFACPLGCPGGRVENGQGPYQDGIPLYDNDRRTNAARGSLAPQTRLAGVFSISGQTKDVPAILDISAYTLDEDHMIFGA